MRPHTTALLGIPTHTCSSMQRAPVRCPLLFRSQLDHYGRGHDPTWNHQRWISLRKVGRSLAAIVSPRP